MSDQATEDRADGFSLVISNTRASAHFARHRFSEYLRSFTIDAECAHDIIMAAGEALANAAEHGHRPNGTLTLRARLLADGLEIEIIDDGHGFAPHPHPASPDTSSPRGFGIHIMRSVMDSVEFHDGGRRVVLSKAFPNPLGRL